MYESIQLIVITGGDALLAAAAALNHSLNREEPFTIETGIQFSAYNSTILSNKTTPTPTTQLNSEQDDDGVTTMHLNILIVLTLVLLILGMITGFAMGW